MKTVVPRLTLNIGLVEAPKSPAYILTVLIPVPTQNVPEDWARCLGIKRQLSYHKVMAGYSQRPLIEKIGIRPADRVILLRAPKDYLEQMPELAERSQLGQRLVGLFDVIQYFATSTEQLEAVLPNLKRHTATSGMLWISWAKKTSHLHTGLDENQVRRLVLGVGLVDVKVAALTADWSGLKFVYRLEDRPK